MNNLFAAETENPDQIKQINVDDYTNTVWYTEDDNINIFLD